MEQSNLRRNKNGYQSPWTSEQLSAGLEYFKELHGRYPTAHDVDAFDYLPSSRSIQRSYGGLVSLRKILLPNEVTDFTRGAHRSSAAREAIKNSQKFELGFYNVLTKNFAEIAIHEHKVIRPGGVNCDFYIYLKKDSGVVIDIFYAESLKNLVAIVNIKLKRYVLVKQPTYLVIVGNTQIEQSDIDEKVRNRKGALPSHIQLQSEKYFFETTLPFLISKSDYALPFNWLFAEADFLACF